jgi:hypothetical protein
MIDVDKLFDYIKQSESVEDAFPAFLHARMPRELRLSCLKNLCASRKTYRDNRTNVTYIFDLQIARMLFSEPENAVRYTALLSDIESPIVDEIESIIQHFPVFSDGDEYSRIREPATLLKNHTEDRISRMDLEGMVHTALDLCFQSDSQNTDLLLEFKRLNASIAISALNWDGVFDEDKLIRLSDSIFLLFRGTIGKLLDADDILAVQKSFRQLSGEELWYRSAGNNNLPPQPSLVIPAVLGQWVTGFLTPCITWSIYTFLRHFDDRLVHRRENYDRKEVSERYKNSCLKDFIPFQTIHRMITRDFSVDEISFRKGDFVCIIPDALFVSSSEGVVSAVIGAPSRPCMGMQISSRIVDAYENYFSKLSGETVQWSVDFELQPTLSALEFRKLILLREDLQG